MSQVVYAQPRRIALLSATAAVAVMASSLAHAQTAASTPSIAAPIPAPEQVEVTGTRIQNNNVTSASPITVVTAKQISQSSAQTIEDVLQKLPEIGSSGLYGTTNNGGVGLSCTDIRNLGINRVLVLVDGKRFVHDSDGVDDCVDLNNIPLNMVDHIEVLKDGASSLYGADAVSGVVNIIMKRNFTGTTATLEGDLPTAGSGSEGKLSVTSGQNFDTGNFTLGAEYDNRSPVSQKDRNWSNRINSGYVGGIGNDDASGSIPYGRILNTSAGRLRATGDGHTLLPYNGSTDSYDFGPAQDLVGGLEKEGITALGHVDFNEYMTGYMEAFFTHKTTTEQLAPEPVYTNSSTALPDPYFIVPNGNPYLSQYTYNGTPLENLLDGENAEVRKRLTELGNREYIQDTNTLELTTGVRGVLPYDVDYDAYYNYGHSSSINQTKNSANIANLEQVVGYSYTPSTFGPTGGTYDPTVCPSFGCSDPFNLSAAAAKYVAFTETDTSRFNLRSFGLDLSKKDVVSLPYGGLGVALGFDHREESGFYDTDSLVAQGLTNESPQQPTGGGFSVSEVYGETAIPILADLPFAKSLTADLSGRYFSYNSFGSGETWKVSGVWEPIPDIKFRASIGTSFRQPSVNELYTSPVNSANGFIDPCNAGATGTIAANCAKQGVPTTFTTNNTQLNTVVGGNPDLQPETARTETLGVVLKPRYVPNLAVTIDYFRTKINNSIGSLDTQTILDQCYGSVNLSSPLCKLIAPRDSNFELVNVTATNQNLGVTKTSGIDGSVTYTLPLGDFGEVTEGNSAEYVMHFFTQDVPNGPFIDSAGSIDVTGPGNDAYPRVKDDNTVSWTNGPWTVGYTTRFISGMQYFNDPTAPPVYTKANGFRVVSTPNIFYHDIEATYSYRTAILTVGVDNILNTNPPFVPDAATNTNANIYDVVGRTVYAKLSYHF